MQAFPIIKFFCNLYGDSKKGSMETTHEVITRLKFIGLIKKGEKVNVKSLIVQQTSYATSFLRMFNQESRETTLDFLTATINRAFELIQLCILSNKPSDKTLCKNLVEDLIKSSVGLFNIQTTYVEDRLYWCHIQTLIQAIEVKLNDLRDSHPDLFISHSNSSYPTYTQEYSHPQDLQPQDSHLQDSHHQQSLYQQDTENKSLF